MKRRVNVIQLKWESMNERILRMFTVVSSLLDLKKLHTRQHVICRTFILVSYVLKRYSNPIVCVNSSVCHLLVLSYLSDRVVNMSVVRAYCICVQTVIMLEDIENSLRNVKWRRVADLLLVRALADFSFLFFIVTGNNYAGVCVCMIAQTPFVILIIFLS